MNEQCLPINAKWTVRSIDIVHGLEQWAILGRDSNGLFIKDITMDIGQARLESTCAYEHELNPIFRKMVAPCTHIHPCCIDKGLPNISGKADM